MWPIQWVYKNSTQQVPSLLINRSDKKPQMKGLVLYSSIIHYHWYYWWLAVRISINNDLARNIMWRIVYWITQRVSPSCWDNVPQWRAQSHWNFRLRPLNNATHTNKSTLRIALNREEPYSGAMFACEVSFLQFYAYNKRSNWIRTRGFSEGVKVVYISSYRSKGTINLLSMKLYLSDLKTQFVTF